MVLMNEGIPFLRRPTAGSAGVEDMMVAGRQIDHGRDEFFHDYQIGSDKRLFCPKNHSFARYTAWRP
jgi:hypothetical protein